MILSRQHSRAVAVLVPLVFAVCSLQAQSSRTITVRMIDSKTGRMVLTSDFLVQINHQETLHADWIHKDNDGAGVLTLPPEATEVMIRGKYDNSMEVYVNCDTEKERKEVHYADVPDHWYPVADILSKGLVAPDGCKSKETAKKDYLAKPGEFIFFVRPHNFREAAQE
jgi:hypothetical protein